MVHRRNKQINLLLILVSYGIILFLSLMHIPENVPETINIGDKWTHLIMYAFLSFMTASTLVWDRWEKKTPLKRQIEYCFAQIKYKQFWLIVWLIPTLWGILMECFQGLTSYRSFSFLDMAANLCGSTLMSLAIWWIAHPQKKQ